MTIHVRFFAIFRQRLNLSGVDLEMPEPTTAASVQAALIDRFPVIADLMPRVALAINREYAKPTETLHDGDELALIPPVSGG